MALVSYVLLLVVFLQRGYCSEVAKNASFADGRVLNGQNGADITLRFLGAGQGTTATHAIKQLMCRLDLVSCHWHGCCGISSDLVTQFAALYSLISLCTMNSEETLQKECGLSSDLQKFEGDFGWRCRRDKFQQGCCKVPEQFIMNPTVRGVGCSAEALLKAAEDMIRRLSYSGVQSLTDSPTSNFLSTFRDLFPETSFRVVMSTRDPKEWAPKRLAEHQGDAVMCGHDNGGRLGDFGGCIQAALKLHEGDRPLTIGEVFVLLDIETAEEALTQHQEQFVPQLAHTFAERAGDTGEDKHGYWLMEVDLFKQSINELSAYGGLDRNQFTREVMKALSQWLKVHPGNGPQ